MKNYLTLFGIFFAGLLGFVVFSYDRVFQVIIAIAVAVAYVFWGIAHHIIHKDFHISIVIEYLLVASLGLIVVFSLIFRT
ncbi:MAG: hypothetical protein Q8P91_03990 [bacterium]|nr:hypothetical protein [bacterium]